MAMTQLVRAKIWLIRAKIWLVRAKIWLIGAKTWVIMNHIWLINILVNIKGSKTHLGHTGNEPPGILGCRGMDRRSPLLTPQHYSSDVENTCRREKRHC